MTSVDEFVNVLVAEMEADQSSSLVDAILRDARAKLKSGKGIMGAITASGVNGKSFTRNVELTASQVVNACRQALNIYHSDGDNDDRVSSTYADFSSLNR